MKKIPKQIKEMQKEDGLYLTRCNQFGREGLLVLVVSGGKIYAVERAQELVPEGFKVGGLNKIYRLDMGDDTISLTKI